MEARRPGKIQTQKQIFSIITVLRELLCADGNSGPLLLLQTGSQWQSGGMISWMLGWVKEAGRMQMFRWSVRWTVPVWREEGFRGKRFRLVLGGKVVDLGRE